jgi:NAD(P)-dependent dehydrogenase (short-subunit alcohol dehydrogenase family)
MDPSALLRPGLLADRVVALGGGSALGPPLAALGATTAALPVTLDEDDAAAHAQGALAAHGRIDVLLHDLRPAFASASEEPLRATLDTAWVTVRAVATTAFVPAQQGGRVTLVAPPPGDGDPAAAGARAAAENLARTLSIEWARYGVTTVAILPGAATSDGEVATLAAYLASPAGAYFSGCRLALGEIAVAAAGER